MLDKTIASVLLNLPAQIVRGKLDGLEHASAQLLARVVDPAAHFVHAKRKGDVARRGIMRMMVLDVMRDGPRRYRDISAIVSMRRPDIGPVAARQRTT